MSWTSLCELREYEILCRSETTSKSRRFPSAVRDASQTSLIIDINVAATPNCMD